MECGSTPRPLVPKKKKNLERFSTYWLLLSAVSVLVLAQSSSEIPEGLMNNPVFLTPSLSQLFLFCLVWYDHITTLTYNLRNIATVSVCIHYPESYSHLPVKEHTILQWDYSQLEDISNSVPVTYWQYSYILMPFKHIHIKDTQADSYLWIFCDKFKHLFQRMRISYAQVTVYSCFGVISGILEPLIIK